MAGFIKIRYNANGVLKNRIINADSIDMIEPCAGPAGRHADETHSRINMKDGTKYETSLTVNEIQIILTSAGALVAELNSRAPEPKLPAAAEAAAPVTLHKRSSLLKTVSSPEKGRKQA